MFGARTSALSAIATDSTVVFLLQTPKHERRVNKCCVVASQLTNRPEARHCRGEMAMGIPFRLLLKAYSCVRVLEVSLAVDDAGLAAVLRLYVVDNIVLDLDAASE